MATRFGWCLTQHHEQCIATMTSDGKQYACSCACHVPPPEK